LLKVYTGLSIGRPIFILTAAKAVIAYASLLLPSFNEAIREKTKIDIHITKVHGEDINRVSTLCELTFLIAVPVFLA
jgi:hypothetical protein